MKKDLEQIVLAIQNLNQRLEEIENRVSKIEEAVEFMITENEMNGGITN